MDETGSRRLEAGDWRLEAGGGMVRTRVTLGRPPTPHLWAPTRVSGLQFQISTPPPPSENQRLGGKSLHPTDRGRRPQLQRPCPLRPRLTFDLWKLRFQIFRLRHPVSSIRALRRRYGLARSASRWISARSWSKVVGWEDSSSRVRSCSSSRSRVVSSARRMGSPTVEASICPDRRERGRR